MKKNLDINLKLLPYEELSKFEDFINSPYFNKLPRLIKLFQFIKKNYDLILKNKLYREDLSSFMYPGEAFKDTSIRKLISDFNKLIEKFAVQKELEEDKVDYNLKLLKQFRKNQIEDKFDRLYKEVELLNEEDRSEVDQYYENRTRLLCERFELLYHKSLKEKKDISQKKSDMLDLEFIMKKIYLYEAMVSIEGMDKQTKYKYSFSKEIDNYIKSSKNYIIKNEPELYRNYLQLKIHIDKDNLELLKDLEKFIYLNYKKNKILRPLIDLSNTYTYVSLRNRNYHSELVKNNFKIYKYIDSEELLNNVKYIQRSDFAKAVQAGINVREFEWTKNFIDKYKNKIEPEFKEDMKNYSYGRLFYESGDYNKSLFFLSLVNFKDYYFYNNAKKLLLRIEYELKNFEDVLLQLESMKKYYDSHSEIADAYKTDMINYMFVISELIKFKFQKIKKNDQSFKKSKLISFVNKNKSNIVYYNWLSEKINELK